MNSTVTRPADDQSDPWYKLPQAAKYAADVSVSTLRRDIKAGRLRAARVGGRRQYVVRRSWIDAYLEATATPVEATQ